LTVGPHQEYGCQSAGEDYGSFNPAGWWRHVFAGLFHFTAKGFEQVFFSISKQMKLADKLQDIRKNQGYCMPIRVAQVWCSSWIVGPA
jgi:hypothetical protein